MYAGQTDIAGRMLMELRGSLEERLQAVLYSEADCRRVLGEAGAE